MADHTQNMKAASSPIGSLTLLLIYTATFTRSTGKELKFVCNATSYSDHGLRHSARHYLLLAYYFEHMDACLG